MQWHLVAYGGKGLQQQLALAEQLHSTYIVQASKYHRNEAKGKVTGAASPPAFRSGKFHENQRSDSNLKAALRLEPKINSKNLTLLTPSVRDLHAANLQINTFIKNKSSHSPGSRKR